MSLTAAFRLSSPLLPFVDVAAHVPDTAIEFLHWDERTTGLDSVIISATVDDVEGLGDAFRSSPSVDDVVLVTAADDLRIYEVTPAGDIGPNFADLSTDEGVPETVTVREDGWHVRAYFPDQDALRALRAFCVENGISFRLDRLFETTSSTGTVPGLTPPQAEALRVASRRGYFEVPRRASLEDAAAELGISRQAFSERLRRAESHVIDYFVTHLDDMQRQ